MLKTSKILKQVHNRCLNMSKMSKIDQIHIVMLIEDIKILKQAGVFYVEDVEHRSKQFNAMMSKMSKILTSHSTSST